MPNLLDYLKWRGDLSFRAAPFCAVDALVLCQICYARLEGVVPGKDERRSVSAWETVDRFSALPDAAERRYLGVLINGEKIMELFFQALRSKRFGSLRLFAYENVTEEENTKQFSALSFLLPDKTVFCAFRGTDDTLVGWKEDFAMAFLPVVPAQQAATEYVQTVFTRSPGRGRPVRLGGHSKGGNLAVYAAACGSAAVRRKLLGVYNFDGPGFPGSRLETPEFQAVRDKLVSFTPEVSIVGMLFDRLGEFHVVASSEKGLQQHDALSWQLDGPHFALLEDVSAFSKFFDRKLKKYLEERDTARRRELVSSIFDIVGASKAHTLTDLKNGGFETSLAILSAILRKSFPNGKSARRGGDGNIPE